MFEGIEFLNKEMFWLFLLLPLAIIWYVFNTKNKLQNLKYLVLKVLN